MKCNHNGTWTVIWAVTEVNTIGLIDLEETEDTEDTYTRLGITDVFCDLCGIALSDTVDLNTLRERLTQVYGDFQWATAYIE